MVDAYAEPRWYCLRSNNLRAYENPEVSHTSATSIPVYHIERISINIRYDKLF